jgi:hypothetical protein
MTSETAEKEAAKNDTMAVQKEAIMKKTKQIAENLEKLGKPAFEFFVTLLPMVVQIGNKLNNLWRKLDEHAVKSLLGFAFCFFGGMFPMVFAGTQAAEQAGRALVIQSLQELATEATRIVDESKKDDDKSKTDKMTPQDYAKHKTLFVLQKMNPDKVQEALNNIWKVWFAVISVLVVQFAQTIQMANSIAEFLKKPTESYAKPVVVAMVPPEYQQWIPVLLTWTTKTVGMTLAWTLASIKVAFASSMQGGLMLSRHGIAALKARNIDLGGMLANIRDLDATKADEYAAYAFAATGFLFQLYNRMNPPFPLNIILFPFTMAEWALRYGVMKASGQ